MKAIHNKTGNEYFIDDVVINTTNNNEDQVMILYHNVENQKFVREESEFLTRFSIENKTLLYKAIELVQKQVEIFNQRITPVAPPKFCSCSNCEQDVLDCDEDCPCEGKCSSEEEFTSRLIDPALFVAYKQQGFTQTDVPLSIVKEEAFGILDKVFTRRCASFVIEEKTYDNATREYFLIGLDNFKQILQVATISKACYEALGARACEEDEF